MIAPLSSTAPSMSCALSSASSIASPALAMRVIRSFRKPSSFKSLHNGLPNQLHSRADLGSVRCRAPQVVGKCIGSCLAKTRQHPSLSMLEESQCRAESFWSNDAHMSKIQVETMQDVFRQAHMRCVCINTFSWAPPAMIAISHQRHTNVNLQDREGSDV